MSSEYYNLEKTAEVLGMPTAEVNRLRERSELRAFRDGSTWKFRKDDVDNYLASLIKGRSKNAENAVGQSDDEFDLLGGSDQDAQQDSDSFDALMDGGLATDDDLVLAPAAKTDDPAKIDNDLSFATDDLMLADDGLSLSKGSEKAASHSDVDLAVDNDDVVFDSAGSSAQLHLASDSSLSLMEISDRVELEPVGAENIDFAAEDSLLEIDEEGDILSLVSMDEDSSIGMALEESKPNDAPRASASVSLAKHAGGDDEEFQLTPTVAHGVDESESASQVIPLEDTDNMFGGAPFAGGFDAPFAAASAATPNAPTDVPFGVSDFSQSAMPVPAAVETQYGGGSVGVFAACLVVMLLVFVMMLDLVVNIASWNGPVTVSSWMMDSIVSVVGSWFGWK